MERIELELQDLVDSTPFFTVMVPRQNLVAALEAIKVMRLTLEQIESTPRNAGARRNARATLRFVENVIEGGKPEDGEA